MALMILLKDNRKDDCYENHRTESEKGQRGELW